MLPHEPNAEFYIGGRNAQTALRREQGLNASKSLRLEGLIEQSSTHVRESKQSILP